MPLSRKQMRNAANALMALQYDANWQKVSRRFRISEKEIGMNNPRFLWMSDEQDEMDIMDGETPTTTEASILMSEAHRPEGHDGGELDE